MSRYILKKSFLIVFLFIFSALATTSCGDKTEKAAEKKLFTIKLVGTLPIGHHCTKAMELFKEEVEKNSKGQIKVELFPAQQLYNDKDLVNVLPKGAVEMALIQPDFWTGLVFSPVLLYLPTLYEDREHYYRVVDKVDSMVTEIINKEFEEKARVKILAYYDYGGASIISKKPITNLEDYSNLRIRSAGKYSAILMQTLNASPISLSSGEVYQALQRGTIDAAISGTSSIVPRKWYEVAKNFVIPCAWPVHPYLLGVHLDFWNSIPPDLQKVVKDAAKKSQDYTKAEEERADDLGEMKKAGMVINELSKDEYARWRKKVIPRMIEELGIYIGKEEVQKIIEEIEKLREN